MRILGNEIRVYCMPFSSQGFFHTAEYVRTRWYVRQFDKHACSIALSGVRRSNCEKCRNCHFTHQAAADGREFTALSDSSGYSGDSVTVKYVET